MKRLFIVLFFLSLLTEKKCFGQTVFTDSIPTQNNSLSERLKGTRLFLSIPANYKLQAIDEGYQKFQRDLTTDFEVAENRMDNFCQSMQGLLKSSFLLQNGDTAGFRKVRVGGFDGVYFTGAMSRQKRKSISLIFGDSSFSVRISGFFLPIDTIAEVEINNILKTIRYDKSIIPDPLELAKFTIDLSITGFKYTVPIFPGMQTLHYSEDGILKTEKDKKHKSRFELQTYTYVSTKDAKDNFKFKIDNLAQDKSESSNVHYRYTEINGNPAYEVTMDEYGASVVNSKLYIVLIQKEDVVLRFWGFDRDNGKWLEKFKSTVQSIKIKNQP